MITKSRGNLIIEASMRGVRRLKWCGDDVVFFAGCPTVHRVVFKRTPTRSPPSDLISFLESIGKTVSFVDVEEEEVP